MVEIIIFGGTGSFSIQMSRKFYLNAECYKVIWD